MSATKTTTGNGLTITRSRPLGDYEILVEAGIAELREALATIKTYGDEFAVIDGIKGALETIRFSIKNSDNDVRYYERKVAREERWIQISRKARRELLDHYVARLAFVTDRRDFERSIRDELKAGQSAMRKQSAADLKQITRIMDEIRAEEAAS